MFVVHTTGRSYQPHVVAEMRSDSIDELDANLELLKQFVAAWQRGDDADLMARDDGDDDDDQ